MFGRLGACFGRMGVVSGSVPFDPLAPDAPAAIVLKSTSDSGISNSDNITNDTTPTYTVSGLVAVAQDGDILNVEVDGASADETLDAGEIAGDSVDVTMPSALPDGTHNVRAWLTRGVHVGASVHGTPTVIDTTAPTISTSATANNVEGVALAIALAANETVAWTISGGADALLFEISGTTLRWASNGVKDFETPDDADTDNAYVVEVTATDPAGNATPKTITVTVTDVDEVAPTITSSATANCTDDTQLSHALTADESVTWSITGGVDQAHFEISGSTLRWASNGTRDFDNPTDTGANNTYVVDVRATDAALLHDDQTITITVVAAGGADYRISATGDSRISATGDKRKAA